MNEIPFDLIIEFLQLTPPEDRPDMNDDDAIAWMIEHAKTLHARVEIATSTPLTAVQVSKTSLN